MSPPPRRRLDALEVAGLVVAAAAVAWQLFVPPVVGLADNGDFDRVLGSVGLSHRTSDYDARYFRWVNLKWDAGPPQWKPRTFTSEQLLAGLSRIATLGFARSGTFDLRALGAVHAFVFLAGLALLLRSRRADAPAARAAFMTVLVFFFTDVGYVALYNSFFTAAASFLFFFLLAGFTACIASVPRSRALWAGFWVAALLFVTSKPQESVMAPLLGALALTFAVTGGEPRRGVTDGEQRGEIGGGPPRRTVALVLAASLALCLAGAAIYFRTAGGLRQAALYNAVFGEMLPRSPDPRGDLAELGFPAEWIAYSGTNAFTSNRLYHAPGETLFYSRVTHLRLAAFWARHPARFAALAKEGAKRACLLRPVALGNFTADSGRAPRERTRAFGIWSGAKAKLAPLCPWLLPLFWLANLAGALYLFRNRSDGAARRAAAALAVLSLMAPIEFFTCLLGEGLSNLNRHLHSFNAMTDLALAADVAFLAGLAARHLGKPATAATGD